MDIDESKIPKELTAYWPSLKALAKPAVGLVRAKEPGFSKLGGYPNLPNGIEIPHVDGIPLHLIAQFELASLPRPAGFLRLPEDGFLYFFHAHSEDEFIAGYELSDKPWWRVIYTQHTPLEYETRPPNALERAEVFIDFEAFLTVPDLNWVSWNRATKSIHLALRKLRESLIPDRVLGPPQSHGVWLGGHFEPLQEPVEENLIKLHLGPNFQKLSPAQRESEASNWIPLFQVESIRSVLREEYEHGPAYFAIRREHLDGSNFDEVWMQMQST